MAEVLPQNFPLPNESAVASYSYTDLAEGTGIRLFYGCTNEDGDGILTQNQIYSHTIESTALQNPPTTSYVLDLDKDFDLTAFNMPQTIKGTAYINGTFYLHTDAVGAGQSGISYIQIKLRKWDGSTETEIANNTFTLTHTSSTTEKKLFCLDITIPETHFKIGEILRATVLIYTKVTAIDSGLENFRTAFCYDPMNRDGTYIVPSTDDPVTISQFKLWIPFKLPL